MIKIFPSILSANILNIEEEIRKLEPYCDGFHLDVMDFHFVPNMTFGPEFINKIAQVCSKQLFVHLMVDDPIKWLNILKLKKNDIFAFHYEATNEHEKIINLIHKQKWLASVAINPKTSIENIDQFANQIDQVLIMSVEPGFAGQPFIPDVFKKIEQISNFKIKNNLNFRIATDGGINKNNITELAKIGVNDFAISSGIFKCGNPINALEELYKLTKL